MIDALFQDLRYGARVLWRSTGFSIVAILTIAIGVAASTAIFSLVNAVLLRPLPFREPDRLLLASHQNNPVLRRWYLDEASKDHWWGMRRLRDSRRKGFL